MKNDREDKQDEGLIQRREAFGHFRPHWRFRISPTGRWQSVSINHSKTGDHSTAPTQKHTSDHTMNRRTFLITTAGVTTPILPGCLGGDQPDASDDDQTNAGEDDSIDMVDTAYEPLKASVAPGTEVRWTNQDSFANTVTSTQFHDIAADWEFDTEISAGESTSFTFEKPGIYEYYCTIHGQGSMCGAVLVGDVTLDEDLPCEGSLDPY